jgi:excisionase family DNA binding protein
MTTIAQLEMQVRTNGATEPVRGSALDGLLDVAGLADHLGVSERFVRRLVDQRRIPFHKIGKFVRFRPDEVSVWVARCKVDALR